MNRKSYSLISFLAPFLGFGFPWISGIFLGLTDSSEVGSTLGILSAVLIIPTFFGSLLFSVITTQLFFGNKSN